jgi:hypothetical protein
VLHNDSVEWGFGGQTACKFAWCGDDFPRVSPTRHHAEQIPGEGRNFVDADFGLYQFDDLIVLKTGAMPAALLECGIIVDRDEEASLQTPEIQHRIADAAAEAIMQFFHTEAGQSS